MTIKLTPINKSNWYEAYKLKTGDEHNQFVASNLFSIAEAQFNPGVTAYAIYNDDQMVGFTMFGTTSDESEDADNRFWLWRLMIAEDQRGKGYGRAALNLIIAEAVKNNQKVVVLDTAPANQKAIALYKSFGFQATGIIEDGEEIYILDLGVDKINGQD